MGKCAIGGSVKCVSAKLDKFCSSNVQFFLYFSLCSICVCTCEIRSNCWNSWH